MAGENTLLSVYGYGSTSIKVDRIAFGLQISTSEDQGSNTKAIYTRAVNSPLFSLVAKFSSRLDRDIFYGWALGYAMFVSNPENGLGPVPMRVQGPRNFDWLGVLTKGVIASTNVRDVTWDMTLVFEGSQPTNRAVFSGFSTFDIGADSENAFYYPGGIQLSGIQNAEDTLYGDPNVIPKTPIRGPS